MSAPKIAFLGPAGTFSDDALRTAAAGEPYEGLPVPTIHDALAAVQRGEASRALVPFENSIEGSVRPTLDALAFDIDGLAIIGEHDHPIAMSLIGRTSLELGEIEVVISHPQPIAQCARFLRGEVGQAEVRSAASTTDAVAAVKESDRNWAALGAASAAELYGCVVIREGVQDEAGNMTRFVWVARVGTPAAEPPAEGDWRTTVIFSELGADHPGALVDALHEFSSRDVNLTRIESRPLRVALGRYMFFIDIEGRVDEGQVAQSVEALRGKAEKVLVLGSYPVAAPGIP